MSLRALPTRVWSPDLIFDFFDLEMAYYGAIFIAKFNLFVIINSTIRQQTISVL